MENKKLIKAIKKSAIKQFEEDLKKSVIKELYSGSSKKQIKKIRKQILRDMQEELFGTLDAHKVSEKGEISSPEFIHTNTVDENEFAHTSVEAPEESKEQEDAVIYEPGRIFEYNGFKFDVDKVSALVTGKRTERTYSKKAIERVNNSNKKDKSLTTDEILKNSGSDFFEKLQEIKRGSNKNLQEEFAKRISTPAPDMGAPAIKYTQGFNINPGTPLSSINTVPSSRNFIKTELVKITPAKREEILFFIGKLKNSINNLSKGERNILYRKSGDEIYNFSYEKPKYEKDDFTFKFNLDLNLKTNGAKINSFDFNIGGFNFDKGFVEILDMAVVFDLVGMNLKSYIDEINEVNSEVKPCDDLIVLSKIKSSTKIETFIDDKKIVSLLKGNDILNYGQLVKVKDLTTLKGIGSKTSKKIESYFYQTNFNI